MISYLRFLKEYLTFRKLLAASKRPASLRWKDRFPLLNDRTATTGFDRHYVFHPAWAARILAATRPAEHVDVSSSLHFCSIVSAFLPVRFYDYRPALLGLDNLDCDSADILHLPLADQSVASLSCMHVVEHIGLGRYGDPLDPEGDLKAIAELKRVLAINGNLLFVVPIGKARIMFNAHRIYTYEQVTGYFSDFKLNDFSLIPDDPKSGGLLLNASKEMSDEQSYGCGCFWYTRMAQ